jgi:hypothetical protein
MSYTGADPGFQVRGAHLNKIASSGGRREIFLCISCEKSRFYTQKKIIFFPILGGSRAGCTPTWIRSYYNKAKTYVRTIQHSRKHYTISNRFFEMVSFQFLCHDHLLSVSVRWSEGSMVRR